MVPVIVPPGSPLAKSAVAGSLAGSVLEFGISRRNCWGGSRGCGCGAGAGGLGVCGHTKRQGKRENTKTETTILKDFFHRECSIEVLAAATPARSEAPDSPFQTAFLLKAAGKMKIIPTKVTPIPSRAKTMRPPVLSVM